MKPRLASRRVVRLALAIPMIAGGLAAGCVLKSPPDAPTIKNEALPTVTVPDAWKNPAAAADPVVDNWVAGFHDEALSTVVAEALAHNADLRVAAARLEQAQLYAKLAGAKLYPSVDVLGHASAASRR